MWSAINSLVLSVLSFTSNSAPNEFDTIQVIFYHGPTLNDSTTYDLKNLNDVLNDPHFDPSKNTTFYVHGYQENQDFESIHWIVDAYNSRGTDNLLVLDWEKLVDGDYLMQALLNYKRFGPVLADKIIILFEAGLQPEIFHLVGHSLGGQMVGYVGRQIKQKTDGKISVPRISALDPAFPGFFFLGIFQTLSDEDGDFVQIIHTDAWSYGTSLSKVHVSFWPNGGTAVQPGCPPRDYVLLSDADLCSHIRSWRYFAQAVSNKFENFYAIKAKSWLDFKLGRFTTPESIIVMGSNTPTDLRGNYYFTTNEASPFSRGIEGIKTH